MTSFAANGIDSAQLQEFESNGYFVLKNAVPPDLLLRLHHLFDELMKPGGNHTVDIVEQQEYISGLEKFCHSGNLAALEMLGQPLVLATAAAICGPDFFMIQEFAVIKMLGSAVPVLWHKDMQHDGQGRCCTMGIYLDDANAGDGALRVIPGSHKSGRDICDLENEPFVDTPVKAGDILVHDMLLAHSSEPMTKNPMRRVLYFEFVSAAHIRAENIYDEAVIVNREKLLRAAVDYFGMAAGGAIAIHPVEGPAREKTVQLRARLDDIYRLPVRARPSAYCFHHLMLE